MFEQYMYVEPVELCVLFIILEFSELCKSLEYPKCGQAKSGTHPRLA